MFPPLFRNFAANFQSEDYGKEDICIPDLRGDYRVGSDGTDEAGAVGTSGGSEGAGYEGGKSGGGQCAVAKGDACGIC